MLIDVNTDELHSYPFVVSLDSCDRTCITVGDPCGRICVPNKIEDVNLEVFKMITGIDESKSLIQHIS